MSKPHGSDFNYYFNLCGQVKIEPIVYIFQNRTGFRSEEIDLPLGDDGKSVFPAICRGLLSCMGTHLCNY